MHNNFYFLRQVTKQLELQLINSVISECFSQNKDELIIRFEIGARSFILKATLSPETSCLSFPTSFQRARKNSVDLFTRIVGRRVSGIRQFNNERSFSIKLSEAGDLLFKMHANRTNVILFEGGEPVELFRKNITADHALRLEALDREIDWSFGTFQQQGRHPKSLYFTLGKLVWKYLEDHGFSHQDAQQQWESIQSVRALLQDPDYFITVIEGKPTLSLLETGSVQKVLHQPIEAANEFFYVFTQQVGLAKEKNKLLSDLRHRLESGKNYNEKNSKRLDEVLGDDHYRLWADLIMANLHAIPPGAEKVTLENFYESQRMEEIKLKRDLTPQKNAELFYRKARNQHIEIEQLESAIRQKEEEMEFIRRQIAEVERISDIKSLRSFQGSIEPGKVKNETAPLPYHEFHYKNYRIWVGKNARANDTLTLKYSFKEDLWLHAKDVSGSHVLIKYQAGKKFPKDVIERAASLAAFNSKRKNETLCPVIVTPKKFVRKRKGDPPGAVVVEREEVIMVAPHKQI